MRSAPAGHSWPWSSVACATASAPIAPPVEPEPGGQLSSTLSHLLH